MPSNRALCGYGYRQGYGSMGPARSGVNGRVIVTVGYSIHLRWRATMCRMKSIRSLGAGVMIVLALLIGSFLGGGSVARAAADGERAATAYMRVAHAEATAPRVDVYVDGAGTPVISNLTFGKVSDYWPVPAGTHSIAFAPAGQPASAATLTGSLDAVAGTSYTVAAVGDTNNTPAVATFQDDNSIASGQSRVRVYHLSVDAGIAAVMVGGQTVIPNVDYKQASDYLTVKPGTYTFDLVIQHGAKTVPLQATLTPNNVTSVFGIGSVSSTGDTGFRFVVVTASGVPTGMPQTGFDPRGASAAVRYPVNLPLALYLLVAALALGIVVAARAMRRLRPVGIHREVRR